MITTESFLYLELWKQLYDWGANVHERPTEEAGVSTVPRGTA